MPQMIQNVDSQNPTAKAWIKEQSRLTPAAAIIHAPVQNLGNQNSLTASIGCHLNKSLRD